MKPHATAINQRLLRGQTPSYERLQARLAEDGSELNTAPIAVHCGWGRLLIGHTFPDPASLAQELLNEQPGERDIALYVASNRRSYSSTRPTPCACGSATIAPPLACFVASAFVVRKAKRTGRRSISCTRRAACCRSTPRC